MQFKIQLKPFSMKKLLTIFCLFLLLQPNARAQEPLTALPDWAIGPFVRPQGVNPIISPDTETRFYDPVQKKKVDWESNDTFNPDLSSAR